MKPTTISKNIPQDSALSYEFLKAEGIRHLQQLVGKLWTDHNAHDPGITILEQLCYAITDVSYRLDHEVTHLLGPRAEGAYKHLYGPASILTNTPVTLQDLRKVVIDVPGVKNAWIEKRAPVQPVVFFQDPAEDAAAETPVAGLYRVIFEKLENTGISALTIRQQVKARLHACRAVGEDFDEIRLLESQPVRLQGTVMIDSVADVEAFVAGLLFNIAQYMAPAVPFYTLQQCLDKGKRIEEIFHGPALMHGFIDDEDLRKASRKTELHTSDIIQLCMDEPAVLAVSQLTLATGNIVKDWVLPLDVVKTPKLDVDGSLAALQFERQGFITTINTTRVKQLLAEKRLAVAQYPILPVPQRDIVLPEPKKKDFEEYYSIQHHFPANYGIATHSLPESAAPLRKAQSKQLSGYLVFFEQVLANYFSQVAHFKDLMCFEDEDRKTYFNQSLLNLIPGLEKLVNPVDYEAYLQEMTADSAKGLARKNQFLDHLLARFSESLTDYCMVCMPMDGSDPYQADKQMIHHKCSFLKDYPALSGGRGQAFNYTQPAWDNDNMAGLEKRIARKLGIEDYTRRNLGDEDRDGFHMIEHILLRQHPQDTPLMDNLRYLILTSAINLFAAADSPEHAWCQIPAHNLAPGDVILITGTENYNGTHTIIAVTDEAVQINLPFTEPETTGRWMSQDITDPYSLQLTFLFPNWMARYESENFRAFVENTVREETPAHLTVYLQWLSKPAMQQADQAYQQFLFGITQR